MTSYYTPRCDKALRCTVDSCVSMIPTSSYKDVLVDTLQKYPVDTSFPLLWSYKINAHIHTVMLGTDYMPYDTFKVKYSHENMTMTLWSHPTWKMIHYYASTYDGTADYALSYKAFISCLQFLLPCAKCRDHLTANLGELALDKYFVDKDSLFLWSYILHQTVNSQTKSKGIPIQEARKLYGL